MDITHGSGDEKPQISTLDRRASDASLKRAALTEGAAKATSQEQTMTLRQGLKMYPKAVLWSVIISTSIVMEGFDKGLIGSLFANLAFKQQFGQLRSNGSYDLSPSWQTALSIASKIGEIFGLMANGILAERFGYRKTIIGSHILVIGFIFIVFFAKSASHLLVGQILLGVPWGVFQTITVAYASEVCPVVLRAYLTTYINLCWVFGQLIASGVLRAMAVRFDQWSYRIPFALQWMWPIPIIIGVFFAPESPWWLVRRAQREQAKAALLRLASRHEADFDPDATIAMMEHTNAMEKAISEGTSYLDCFRGTALRRTEIACCTWLVQIFTGVALMGYSAYFYVQAGLAVEHAFTMTMAQYALGAVGTICSWGLMARFGRRTLYLWGITGMFCWLLVAGIVSVAVPNSAHNAGAGWAIGSLLIVWTATYDMTVGPVCYALVSELASTRLRSKTIVLARCSYNAGAILLGILTPRMLNPTAWNWGARSAFFWAGCALLCFVWVFFRLPEPKGRTYGELDIMFERRIPARKFAQTKIDTVNEGRRILKEADIPVVETVEKA